MAETPKIEAGQLEIGIINKRLERDLPRFRADYALELRESDANSATGERLATLARQAVPDAAALERQLQIQMGGRTEQGDPGMIPPAEINRFNDTRDRVQLLHEIRIGNAAELQALLVDPVRGPQIQAEIWAVIGQDPKIQAEFAALPPAVQRDYMVSIISSNETKMAINRALLQVGNSEGLARDGVEAARAAARAAEQEMLQARDRLNEVRLRPARLDAELAHFETTVDPGTGAVTEGPLLRQLNEATATINALDGDTGPVAQMTEQLDILDKELTGLREKSATLMSGDAMRDPDAAKQAAAQTQVDALQKRITDVEKRRKKLLTDYSAESRKLGEAKAKRAELEEKRKKLQEEKAELPQRTKEAEDEFRSKQEAYRTAVEAQNEAIDRQNKRRDDLQKEVQDALSRGVAETINNDVREITPKLLAVEQKRIDDAAEQAKTDEERRMVAIERAIDDRYRNGTDRVNWDNFRDDWDVFLNPAMNIEDQVRATFITGDPAREALYDSNAEFRKKVVDNYKEKMMKLRGVEPGGNILWGRTRLRPINEREGQRIMASLGGEYLDNLVNSNKAVQEKLKQLKAAGLGGGSFMGGRFSDALKKMPWGVAGIILAVVLGGVGLSALGAV